MRVIAHIAFCNEFNELAAPRSDSNGWECEISVWPCQRQVLLAMCTVGNHLSQDFCHLTLDFSEIQNPSTARLAGNWTISYVEVCGGERWPEPPNNSLLSSCAIVLIMPTALRDLLARLG